MTWLPEPGRGLCLMFTTLYSDCCTEHLYSYLTSHVFGPNEGVFNLLPAIIRVRRVKLCSAGIGNLWGLVSIKTGS